MIFITLLGFKVNLTLTYEKMTHQRKKGLTG